MKTDNIIKFPIKTKKFLNSDETQEFCAHICRKIFEEIEDYLDKKEKMVDIEMISSLFIRIYAQFMYSWFTHPSNKDAIKKLEGKSVNKYASALAKKLLVLHFEDIEKNNG
jgi:hypothetical protein